MKISIVLGNIAKYEADAIVNAANPSLMGGGGVDGAIHKAAGPELKRECQSVREKYYPKGLPVGKAVATKAYNLKAKIIIHTVGPVYEKDNLYLLKDCYRNCLRIAEENKCQSIAFPAISTGAYGVPVHKSAQIVLKTLSDFKSAIIKQVILVLYAENDYHIYKRVFGVFKR